jgi:hypothetical protein
MAGRNRLGGMIDRLYRRLPPHDGLEAFESTDGTRSNWDSDIQHGSPPLALMTKTIEESAAGTSLRVGRLTLDILGAIPVVPVTVRTWTARPGTTSDTRDVATDRHPPLAEGEPVANAHGWLGAPGYLETVGWRTQATPDGAAAEVWMSPLVSLVDDEPVTDVQRLAMIVDSANGVGAALDPDEFLFMNTDTTVHLHRVPKGTDFALRARASIGPDGVGVTTAELFDRDGFVGTSAQTLLVLRR